MLKNNIFSLASFIHLDKVLFGVKKKFGYSTILSLHRISDEVDFFWPSIQLKTFKQLLEYCAKNYEVTHLSDIHATGSGRPRLALSFDDGYHDFIENGLPELKRYGLPSNHNVVIDCVERNQIIWTQDLNDVFLFLKANRYSGSLPLPADMIHLRGEATHWMEIYFGVYRRLLKMNRDDKISILKSWRELLGIPPPVVTMMNWSQVIQCANHDVEIGSHTMTHHTLSSVKTIEELKYEVGRSKQILEDKLQFKCKTLALPNGQFDDATLQSVRDAGYERVLLANDQFMRSSGHESASFLIIPRINMVQEPFSEMRLRLEGFHHLIRNGRI